MMNYEDWGDSMVMLGELAGDGEDFMPIKGFEDKYWISSWGRVWSIKSVKFIGQWDNGCGYLCVSLYKDCERKNCKVHRLVAEAFVDNFDNKPEVNHLDEDKNNNRYENLAWVTHEENMNYGTQRARAAETRRKRRRFLELNEDKTEEKT